MTSVTTIAEMNRNLIERCKAFAIDYDCGCDGKFDAEVVVIAEAPGERERILKMPLSGSSGKLLWDTLRPYGITRRSVYVTNVVKRQLLAPSKAGHGYEKKQIEQGELSLYNSVLSWELNQLPNVRVVICLGNFALQALTGYTGITSYRGSVMDVQLQNAELGTKRDIKVIALLNPAAVLREPKNELMFKFDCKRINDVITGKFQHYEIKEHIDPTFEEVMAWIAKMRTEGKPVGFDVETSSGEVDCFGLANDPHEGMCIPLRTQSANRWTVAQETQLWLALARLVTDPNVRLVMQNGMYDASWNWFIERVKVTSYWFDTMLAHHTLYPIMPHNQGFIVTQYTTHPYYKDEINLWRETGDIRSRWSYNVKDVCTMLKAQQAMLKELEQQGMAEFFFSHVMPLQPELVDMTVHGVAIDVELKAKIAEELKHEVAKLKEEYFAQVQLCTGDPEYRPNPNSPKQMAELFFNRLRLVGRGVATDKENRRRMREHPRTPENARTLLVLVDKLAEEQKFYSTYAEMTIDDDNRVRCEYKQMGVQRAPGRLSSSATGWGTGTNLQNQPGRAHSMFVADTGYEFSYFDLSQAEARVVGWRYNIPHWIEDFERARIEGGYDAHRALAAQMWNMEYDETPEEDWDESGKPTRRYIAKRSRHGLNYRMMPDRFATVLGVSNAEAEYLWALYHKINPQLQLGWEFDVETVKRDRKLVNAYGRRWMLLERFSEEATESIVAFYPQSTIGDKVTRIIRQCHRDKEWPRSEARICLNIHDALIALHSASVGAEVRGIMKKYAQEPIPILGVDGVTRELIIPCDLKASMPDEHGVHRWSTLSKVKE